MVPRSGTMASLSDWLEGILIGATDIRILEKTIRQTSLFFAETSYTCPRDAQFHALARYLGRSFVMICH